MTTTDLPAGDAARQRGIGTDPVLEVRGLQKYFPIKGKGLLRRTVGNIKAVDGIDLTLFPGETLGLVGESGCGKSTTGRAILNLQPATEGSVKYNGRELVGLGRAAMRPLRREIQIVFQDPYASLNPRLPVLDIVGEPLIIHKVVPRNQLRDRVNELLKLVGLNPEHNNRYPHEFSGGQRQRIGIARAIALEPELIVADEPVSALDVSIQAQIVNLLEELQQRLGLTYLVIAHDLAVVRHISDVVGVMYLGVVVEQTSSHLLYTEPLHPYTRALMSAVPIPDPDVEDARQRILLSGDLPSPANPPSGCRFRTRCPWVQETRCADEVPALREVRPGHVVACHWTEEIDSGALRPNADAVVDAAAL
jgi:peptide/nickel transport system ATP-binding protein